MSKTKSTSYTSTGGHPLPTNCDDLQQRVAEKCNQLDIWQSKLDQLLSDPNGDINSIGILTSTVDRLNRELNGLKAEQRKLGCIPEDPLDQEPDNQTILSTASTRRKDRFALERTAKYR